MSTMLMFPSARDEDIQQDTSLINTSRSRDMEDVGEPSLDSTVYSYDGDDMIAKQESSGGRSSKLIPITGNNDLNLERIQIDN